MSQSSETILLAHLISIYMHLSFFFAINSILIFCYILMLLFLNYYFNSTALCEYMCVKRGL